MTGATLQMSREAIRWALRDAPGVPAQCVSVLVGLADHADKFGRGAYPSAATLAAYARKSVRQVQSDLGLLMEAKLIWPGEPPPEAQRIPANRRPVVYDLAMEPPAGVQPASPQGVQSTASQSDAGVQSASPQDSAVQSTSPHTDADLPEDSGVQPASPQAGVQPASYLVMPGMKPTADKPSTSSGSVVDTGSVEGGSGGEKSARSKRAEVGRRLPDDFRVTPEMVAWHRENTPAVDGRRETEKFIDHWRSASGANARKRDWVAAWRNWMRKADDDLARPARANHASSNGHAAPPAGVSPRDEHRYRR